MKCPTILVVNDDPLTCKLLRIALQSEGYTVLEAGDGAAALRAMAADPPDLVLQDLVLPDVDGIDLVEQLRAFPGGAELPILAYSGFLSRMEEARHRRVGFTDYLLKPVEVSQLLAVIRGYVPPPAILHGQPGRGRRILVVDDDPLQRKLLGIHLERLGFSVVTAEDGADALDQLSRLVPDAVVSDVVMPRIDGFNLCLGIRRDPRLARIPVVLASAVFTEEGDRRLAENVGANAFVQRAPDARELAEALLSSLEEPRPLSAALPVELRGAEYADRIASHLWRQTNLSADLSQRLAWLEAKLAILAGLAETLQRSAEIEPLVDEILCRALEASGAPSGAGYLFDFDGHLSMRAVFGYRDGQAGRLGDFFGRFDLLRGAAEGREPVEVPSSRVAEAEGSDLLERAGAASMLITPLVSSGESLGALVMAWPDRERPENWRFLSSTVASQASQAISLAHAIYQLRESEERLAHLQSIADSAIAHLTLDDLLRELLSRIGEALGCDTVTVLLVEGDSLVVRATRGLGEELRGARIPLGEGFVGLIASSRGPLAVEDIALAPLAAPTLREKGVRSLLGVPLLVGDRVIGVLHIGTFQLRRYSAKDLQLLELVADRVASAVERTRLYEAEQAARAEAEASRQRLDFLARASVVLSETLDYESTLSNVARLAVPGFADWCTVDMVADDGSLELLAMAHVDPENVRWAKELRGLYPMDPNTPVGPPNVARTGESEIYPDIPDSLLVAIARNDEELRLLRQVGYRSVMMVPMQARGRTVGVISLVSTESGRRYGQQDLALAEELARRCALALDNALLYQAARRAVAMRDEFLSVAAHELRTPVTSLKGFAQIAIHQMDKDGVLDPVRIYRSLKVIDQQSSKLSNLMSQLLDISRIDAGKLMLDRKVVDVARLVEGVVGDARVRTGRENLIVRADSPALAPVDPLRLEQVVGNLVDNAIKYSPNGEPIEIEVTMPAPETVQVVVRDRGIGIPPEHHDRIFERYFQLQSGQVGGMGLGLFISRRIVDLHGGSIDVESPPDGGTRFTVTLPTDPA